MLKRIVLIVTASFLLIVSFEGCYNDKADQQYPVYGGCDTTTVTYSIEIKDILDNHCQSCHKGSNSIVSGFDLYDYNTIATLALDGKFTYGTLLSAVMHTGGAPPMPQGAPQLQSCEIDKMRAWVNRGAPDN